MKYLEERHRKDTRATSKAVAAALEARMTRAPLAVVGISQGVLRVITPSQFKLLDVDADYQRGETTMVNEIVRAIQAGGSVLDPVTLCRRPWDEDPERFWIVDGHQRVCAFQQLGLSFQAMVHDSDSLDSEKRFFLTLNNRRSIVADVIVKSWTGPSSVMIQKANKDQSHSLYGRVNFAQSSSNVYRMGATTVAKAMLASCTGLDPKGSAVQVCGRADTALKEKHRLEMAEKFLTLLGDVFPSGGLRAIVAIELGKICWAHWSKGGAYPSVQVIKALRDIKWENHIPAWTKKYAPKVQDMIKQVWK